MSLTQTNVILWGSYKEYEGPFFMGKRSFILPQHPTEADKQLEVITAAEGGHYDAINMYDRGIISVGIIQWIEAGQLSVSDMLGAVAEEMGEDAVLVPLADALKMCDATFKKNAAGQWRFYSSGIEVNTDLKSRALFLGCSGTKGSWTNGAKLRAKIWAAGVANVWQSDKACEIQNDFTCKKLPTFILSDAKKLFDNSLSDEGWVGALRAAFLSFAVNLPSVANRNIAVALQSATVKNLQPWSSDWCIAIIKQLTYGTAISIYPTRYNCIRPVLEKSWGVKLPRTALDLANWQPNKKTVVVLESIPQFAIFDHTLPIRERISSLVNDHIGCSLTQSADRLKQLVAKGIDDPDAMLPIATNCYTTTLGILWAAGVEDPVLMTPHSDGTGYSNLIKLAKAKNALLPYKGLYDTLPQPGDILIYELSLMTQKHVEWLLSEIDPFGCANHAGGGRINNELCREYSSIETFRDLKLTQYISVSLLIDEEEPKLLANKKDATPEVAVGLTNQEIEVLIDDEHMKHPNKSEALTVEVQRPLGLLGFILHFIHMLLSLFTRKK